jgi:hypothetical protein
MAFLGPFCAFFSVYDDSPPTFDDVRIVVIDGCGGILGTVDTRLASFVDCNT